LLQLLSLPLVGLPRVISPNSAGIRDDTKARIYPLLQHGQTLWIHHFSEQPEDVPK
jgi:hypothetical protein